MFDYYFGQKANSPYVHYRSMNVQAEDFKCRMEPLRATLGVKNHKRLKIRSVEEGCSMTEIAIGAISTYLSDK